MSAFGIVAIIVLPVLGGLIAWAGDVIGYRLGKSRRTLFGLRPRTTARLVGVAVGVGLPLVGLATALVGSGYARQALFELDHLIARQDELQTENRQLEARVRTAREQARTARQQADATLLQANDAKGRLLEARRRLRQAESGLGRARRSLTRLQGQVATLKAVERNLKASKEDLKAQVGRLQGRLYGLEAQVKTTDEALTQRTRELQDLETRRDELQKAYLLQRAVVSGPVLFEPDYELIRVVLPTRQREDEVAATLTQVLLAASEAAHERGVPLGPTARAVKVMGPLPPDWNPAAALPSEEEIIRYVARELRALETEKAVVSVRVDRRVFEGEDVPARVAFTWLPHRLVFRSGEVIYAVTIDGGGTRTEIFNQLWNLITKLVRREAQDKGLLPNPRTGEYGTLPSDELLDALDQVAARDAPTRVEVRAARDTYNSDALSVEIEVADERQSSRRTGRGARG
ncbi:MAG: DUF3084 domain-containing protein [Armatimonadetes bacterium]|nr:DUF3084 domain-containing protein [Armatimonadota bacterium]